MNNKYGVDEFVVIKTDDSEVICRVLDIFRDTCDETEYYEYTLIAEDDTERFFYFVPEELIELL